MRNASYSAPSESLIFAGANRQRLESPDTMAAAGSGKAASVTKDKGDPCVTVGRNDPCPCGNGKKYKKCHGANT